jgi:ACS family tartrate transporter-like MFS transporter
MITWGIAAAVMAFVVGPVSFLTLRFLLGVAEAGFFPGMILYFTYWFPAKYRARVIAALFLAVPGANAVTAVVSGALLQLDGALGCADGSGCSSSRRSPQFCSRSRCWL